MTEQQKQRFLARFSTAYDLPGAAHAAGIGRGEAYRLLKHAAAEVDALVQARLAGEVLSAIRGEYERMAFGGDDAVRPADRIRALEQLRLIASAVRKDGGAPALVIRCEYV